MGREGEGSEHLRCGCVVWLREEGKSGKSAEESGRIYTSGILGLFSLAGCGLAELLAILECWETGERKDRGYYMGRRLKTK